MIKYKDGQIVNTVFGDFVYVEFYDRLEKKDDNNTIAPAILCPKCLNSTFTISYGEWECIANCSCGHKMTIYDG